MAKNEMTDKGSAAETEALRRAAEIARISRQVIDEQKEEKR